MEHVLIVIGKYLVDLDVIDQHRPAHVDFLKRYFDEGILIASGPQNPRVGGAILAKNIDKASLEQIFQADPFVILGLAEYQFIDFIPTLYRDDFKLILQE